MAVESAADRLAMLADFGVECRFTLSAGGQPTIKAIFDDDYAAAEVLGVELESSTPILSCRTADVSDVVATDAVRVYHEDCTQVDYVVRGIHPDGTGMTVLVIEKAAA